MSGFEPRTSGVGSIRSINWPTTTAQGAYLFLTTFYLSVSRHCLPLFRFLCVPPVGLEQNQKRSYNGSMGQLRPVKCWPSWEPAVPERRLFSRPCPDVWIGPISGLPGLSNFSGKSVSVWTIPISNFRLLTSDTFIRLMK